jgi:hypothetical protein
MKASFAVSSLSGSGMVAIQPPEVAGLPSNLPNPFSELAGGEVNQVLSTCGVRGALFEFMQLEGDGLPANYNRFFSEWDYRPDETYDRVEVVRGGRSGIFALSAAAAIGNFVTAVLRTQMGNLTVSAEAPGDERMDVLDGGQIPSLKEWYFSVGRQAIEGEGARAVGFLGEYGEQFRVAVERDFEGGSILLTCKHIDLHNVDNSPSPAFAVAGSNTTAIAGFDPRI